MDEISFPMDFPREEFKQKIEELLKNKPLEVKEKELQDFIHDVLRDRKTLTGKLIIEIHYEWPKTIEKIMFLKKYIRSPDNPDIYSYSKES